MKMKIIIIALIIFASNQVHALEINKDNIHQIVNEYMCTRNIDRIMEMSKLPFFFDNEAIFLRKAFLRSTFKDIKKDRSNGEHGLLKGCSDMNFVIEKVNFDNGIDWKSEYSVHVRVLTKNREWPHDEDIIFFIEKNGLVSGITD